MQHDACGVGFVARIAGDAGHDIVDHGLTALVRLAHRGAPASLGAVDGCGLLTDIPWSVILRSIAVPAGRTRAIGMLFIEPSHAARAVEIVEREFQAIGAAVAWRTVPVERGAVLKAQRASTPRVVQAVVALADARARAEQRLFDVRLKIEAAARRAGVRLQIASLSTRTVVYKALTPPEGLPIFYPDLADEAFASRFAVFHQRFSTNTSADWALAQPFRLLAHNGEINTIAGNRSWMRARLRDATSLPGFRDCEPVAADGSDSRSLDDAVELLRNRGYSVAHAVTRLIPPAWERDRDMAPDVRAFHEFQSLLGEPWDGPSALAFADGRFVGAALDRNGFRPARLARTAAGLIAVASETGVLAATEHEIVERDRLGPGDMLMVDLERGAVMRTNEIHRRLAFRHRYRHLVEQTLRTPAQSENLNPNPVNPMNPMNPMNPGVYGVTREEIEVLIKPMIADGHEAIGSMGDDTPPAALSSRARLFTDYFRQRFAQVTNPPIDPYRESSVMSLTTYLGGHGSVLDESAARPPRIVLRSPILTTAQFVQLHGASDLRPATIAMLFPVAGGPSAMEQRIDAMVGEAKRAVDLGAALIVLSDRDVSSTEAPIPALLAMSAVHHGLIAAGLRMRVSIVVDTADARNAHQIAALCAFGASAIHPSLGYQIVTSIAPIDGTGCDRPLARYRLALERGLLTIMSKMGVCTFSSYCGAQLFEILGLDRTLTERFFPGAATHPGSTDMHALQAIALARHVEAFGLRPTADGLRPTADGRRPTEDRRPPTADRGLPTGLHGFRRDGEYHATNPLVVRGLRNATDAGSYATFTSHVHNRPPAAVRDLLEFAPAKTTARLADVEPVETILTRFFASAMSVGALSPEAHRTIARAMNMIGARSNSGEGGEEPDRYGRDDGNRTRQVASARFGVTPAYLRSADELQIKIAQGSKPGEGGQLPALKVVPHIARLRHAQPGQPLISPPVHHDIYSIEDLAELIHDLRTFHPHVRINVKLVASSGVGVIAAGVAKAGADAIQISGHDGGTGASPRGSIKHAGLPWEIGLSEAHRALRAAGLRDRVVLQTDGGLKTGRDIAMAAALGADEYGFGTAALIAIGCVMARQCHANTCPVGIATQREDLRDAFNGTPEMLIGYLRLVAGEVREILASLGLRTVDELIGRSDLLRGRRDVRQSIDVAKILDHHEAHEGYKGRNGQRHEGHKGFPELRLPLVVNGTIANTDRAFGADIAGAIAAQHGDAGVADGSVTLTVTGSAGQSFGAFALPGMRLSLVGDANDGLGKAMHGGRIVVTSSPRERGRADQVLVGNAALYGATGGRVFIAGRAGERFAVRNSGATAVVEGIGDHGCEYMTAGTVVILGTIGRNFASGMTGGVAYVCDRKHLLTARTSPQHVSIEPLAASDHRVVLDLLEAHERLTGSRLARAILRNDRGLTTFRRVVSAVAPAVAVPERAATPVDAVEQDARELTA